MQMTPRYVGLALVLGLTIALSSCGGGAPGDVQANANNTGGVGTGGTGSYTNGPISGLGSIIVNNVRYNVAGATVISDDELAHDASELQLGMLVEVNGSEVVSAANGSTPQATADKVRFSSELIGQISATDGVNATITVLGQTVRINSKTVQPLSLAVHDVVAVYGLSDATGLIATRIDKLQPNTDTFKLAGVLVSRDAVNKILYIGQGSGTAVSYVNAGDLPDGLSAGQRVRVWFSHTPRSGQWSATRVRVDSALVQSSQEASLEGLITQLPDVNQVMRVNGALVNISGLPRPLPTLVMGQRIRVEGPLLGGVLMANEFSNEDASEIENQSVELHGQVGQLDTQALTFVLRGVAVSYTPAVVHGGTLSDSVCVEVQGRSYNPSRQLIATEVEVSDDCP